MKKTFLMVLSITSFVFNLHAQEFTTSGDGTVYSFDALSQISGSGVTLVDGVYAVNGVVTIASGDNFVIDSGATVNFGDESELIIKGKADLNAASPTLLGRLGESSSCYGVNIQSEEVTEVSNLTFEYVGLRGGSTAGMNVSNCTFLNHNGTASGALFLGGSGASFNVTNCEFQNCQKAAIGGAANYFCPLVVEDCVFRKNSQANNNIPQLNLTASENITIRNCVLEGDSTLTMAGGIGIANWYGTEGLNACIEGCEITNSRYGITTMGVMNVLIRNNVISNNKFEVNPNNGGSGISLYDPYYKQVAIITGNTIEKNLWGITVIGCGSVNLGKTEVDIESADYNPGGNIFRDNGNQGVLYDLFNNSANDVYAQGNFWNVPVQDSVNIETVVYHKNDDPSLGEVIFMPAGDTEGISAPTSDDKQHSGIYSIQGVRINDNQLPRTKKSIYIINGKKVVR